MPQKSKTSQKLNFEEAMERLEKIVEARFALRHFNLADDDSAMAAVDAVVIENMKTRWKLLK